MRDTLRYGILERRPAQCRLPLAGWVLITLVELKSIRGIKIKCLLVDALSLKTYTALLIALVYLLMAEHHSRPHTNTLPYAIDWSLWLTVSRHPPHWLCVCVDFTQERKKEEINEKIKIAFFSESKLLLLIK